MNRKLTIFICIMALGTALVASCQNDPEDNRAVVTVASINENAPFFSDVLEQGDTLFAAGGGFFTQDDFAREEMVEVTFFNRPFNSLVTTGPGQPFNDFLITAYRVEWRRADGGLVALPTYDGATSIICSSNEFTTGNLKTLISSDIYRIGDLFHSIARNGVPCILALIILGPVIVYYMGVPGLLAMLVGFGAMPLAFFLGGYVHAKESEIKSQEDTLSTIIGEWVTNVRLLRFLGWDSCGHRRKTASS